MDLREEMDLYDVYLDRQSAMIPRDISELSVAVFGVGGIGSNAAHMLASMGAREFILVDFDVVEQANVYPGHFILDDVGKKKAEVVAASLGREFEGVEALAVDGEVREAMAGEFPDFDIGLAVTDNIESRREAWEGALARRERPKLWIDARMGGPGYTIIAFTLDDKNAGRRYNEREVQMRNVPLACGEKATAMLTKGIIPFVIGAIVRKYLLGQPFPYIFTGDADRLDLLLATNTPNHNNEE